ncbi:glycoside hydrolase family 10 protein, partial [Candidatus Zixiibacteriota bacterium]
MKHSEGNFPGRTLILGGLILLTIIGLGASAVPAEEARCVWFHRWEWSDRQDIENTIQNIENCNMNAVVFQIRGQGDAFYISDHEPWSTLVGSDYPGYDPLAVAIYEARSRGLELHAYVNAMPAWSGSSLHPSPDHIYNAHPEWIMVDSSGVPMDPADGYANISPGIPQAAQHLNNVIVDIATNYDVDGIHLDYIRYPGWDSSNDYSYDDSSLVRFAREYPGCTPNSCPGEWDQFRRDQVTAVVRAAHDSVTALKPWVKISAATWGVFSYGYNYYYQDSHGWLEDGILDFSAPMIYTASPSTFQSRLHDHAVNKYGRHVYAGIGVY